MRPNVKARGMVALAAVAVLAVGWWLIPHPMQASRASGPLAHQVYVWQRAWTPALKDSIARHAGGFERLVILAGQVDWELRQPRIIRVPVDYGLAKQGAFGLAVRVSAFSGSFDSTATTLADLTKSILDEAAGYGLTPEEVQLDFDCAESRLAGYRTWARAIRGRIAPVKLTITALPSWLNSRDFAALAGETDGFVLQVHSVDRPQTSRSMTLCDPAAARAVVERAGRLGLPFRVALPTYGYHVGFASDGRFLGVSAEGPVPSWPADAAVRELEADPAAMADLVRDWTDSRPATLVGVIWYRFPTTDDRLNWRWPTLEAVMRGRIPSPLVTVAAQTGSDGLVEIILSNRGDADGACPSVDVNWTDAQLAAYDAIAGYSTDARVPATAFLVAPTGSRLRPGEVRTIAWFRFNRDTEVKAHVHTNH